MHCKNKLYLLMPFMSGSQLNKYVLIMQGSHVLQKQIILIGVFFVSGSQLNKHVLIMQASPALQKQIIFIGALFCVRFSIE
jgi:hypothetical protein